MMMSEKITKEDLKGLVEQCKRNEAEAKKAITFMETQIKKAKLDLKISQVLIKKFK